MKKEQVKIELDNKHALANYLGCKPEELEGECNSAFSYGGEEYLVLTDSEADEAVSDYIKESLWAFNAVFILQACKLDYNANVSDSLKKSCENCKKTCGLEYFTELAIQADGRGNFLSGYDGEENEEGEYFIYRIN